MPCLTTNPDTTTANGYVYADDENIDDASAINDGEEDDSFDADTGGPAELPDTGPAEIATAIIALVCISSVAVYWFVSRKQLRAIEQAVQSGSEIAPKRTHQKIFIHQRDVVTRKRKKQHRDNNKI